MDQLNLYSYLLLHFTIKLNIYIFCTLHFIHAFFSLYTPNNLNKIEPQHKDIGKSGSVVMSLLEFHFGKGDALYVDNWYIKPALFGILHKNSANACVTVYTP